MTPDSPMTPRTALSRIGLAGGVTLGRMLGTLLLLAMVARAVEPAPFGVFGYWYAVGVMAAALTEYGFAQHLLASVPRQADPALRQAGVDDVTGAKRWLVLAVGTIAIGVALLACDDAVERAVASLLIAAAMAGSIGELNAMLLRALGAFRLDAWTGAIAGLLAPLAAGAVALASADLVMAAAALLAVRMAAIFAQAAAVRRHAGLRLHWQVRAGDGVRAWRGLRASLPSGVDNLAIQLLLNVDLLASRLLLEPLQAGLYLSANRLTNAAHAGFPVLMSVFLPALVASGRRESGAGAGPLRLLAVAGIAFGLAWNLVVWSAPADIAVRLFGAGYAAAGELLGPMAIGVGLRYLSLAPSLRLIAAGRLYRKAVATLAAVATAALAVWLQQRAAAIDAQALVFSVNLANAVQTLLLFAMARPTGSPGRPVLDHGPAR